MTNVEFTETSFNVIERIDINEDDTCPICYDPLTHEGTAQYGCNHKICIDCLVTSINTWKTTECEAECCMCRNPISDINFERESTIHDVYFRTREMKYDEFIRVNKDLNAFYEVLRHRYEEGESVLAESIIKLPIFLECIGYIYRRATEIIEIQPGYTITLNNTLKKIHKRMQEIFVEINTSNSCFDINYEYEFIHALQTSINTEMRECNIMPLPQTGELSKEFIDRIKSEEDEDDDDVEEVEERERELEEGEIV